MAKDKRSGRDSREEAMSNIVVRVPSKNRLRFKVSRKGVKAGQFCVALGGYNPGYTRPGNMPPIPRIDLRPLLAPEDGNSKIQAYVPTNFSKPVRVGDLVMVRASKHGAKKGLPEVNLRITKVIDLPRLPQFTAASDATGELASLTTAVALNKSRRLGKDKAKRKAPICPGSLQLGGRVMVLAAPGHEVVTKERSAHREVSTAGFLAVSPNGGTSVVVTVDKGSGHEITRRVSGPGTVSLAVPKGSSYAVVVEGDGSATTTWVPFGQSCPGQDNHH
ncbi:hypothetical protein ABZ769_33690 [Streptomyces olivoreticuli]